MLHTWSHDTPYIVPRGVSTSGTSSPWMFFPCFYTWHTKTKFSLTDLFIFLCFLFFLSLSFLFIVYCVSSVLMPLIPLHHTTQTSMPPAGYKPAIPASEQPQAPALHSAATTIGPERKVYIRQTTVSSSGSPFLIFATRLLTIRESCGKRVLCCQRNNNAITVHIIPRVLLLKTQRRDMISCILISVARIQRPGETCCLNLHEVWCRSTGPHRSHPRTSQS